MANYDFSKIYSFSKLNLFDSCPKKYYFNYLDPEIAPRKKEFFKPRDYKTKGQAVHGALTLFYHLPKKERTFDSLKDCLKQSWYSEIDMYQEPPLMEGGGFTSLNHERRSYVESLLLLKHFFDFEDIDPPLFYMPTKDIKNSFCDYQEMIKPVNEYFSISGKFDRIDELADGTLRIIDFKTNKNGKANQDQLIFYKLLAELNFKKPVKLVSFYYLNQAEIVDMDVSKTGTERIKNDIIKQIAKINKEKDFKPNFSGLCHHCDFFEICSARKVIRTKLI
ncbi:MAG: PD-(D/E)XK nuclease family protein [Patescibacteria group bacterium]